MNPQNGKGSARRKGANDKAYADNYDRIFGKKLDCPQCGEPTDQFYEGYCETCCEQNQRELDEHNASYDRWHGLSDEQRDLEIKRAR